MTGILEPAFVRWVPTEHHDQGLDPGWWHELRGDQTRCGIAVEPFTNRGVHVDQRIGWRGGARWVPQPGTSAADDSQCSICTAEHAGGGFGD